MNSEDVQVMRGIALELIDQYLGAPNTDWVAAFERLPRRSACREASPRSTPARRTRRAARASRRSRWRLTRGRYADPWYGPIAITEREGRAARRLPADPGLTGHLEHVRLRHLPHRVGQPGIRTGVL
jgi:hypothetical protein